jgi:hypothetical protein
MQKKKKVDIEIGFYLKLSSLWQKALNGDTPVCTHTLPKLSCVHILHVDAMHVSELS